MRVTYTAPVDNYLYGSPKRVSSRDIVPDGSLIKWGLHYLEEDIVYLRTPNTRVVPVNDP